MQNTVLLFSSLPKDDQINPVADASLRPADPLSIHRGKLKLENTSVHMQQSTSLR